MTNELTVIPRTIGMVTRMMDAVNIEDAVIVSEEEQKEHPNFIESNTSGITLEELERNCIVPSFGDNQLTISHQKFIHQVEDAAKVYFTGENFGNTEIRVSHKILGRVPGALTKRKEELRPEDEAIYYQRMAFCFHIRSMSRMMNGEEVHLCIGGVRSLNEENLYARKSPEKFKIFIGWRVRVCSNLDSHLIRLQTVLPDYPYDRLAVVACRDADLILGPIGIVLADALLGEVTAAMAAAVSRSRAHKILIPLNRCGHTLVGVQELPLGAYIDQAAAAVRAWSAAQN